MGLLELLGFKGEAENAKAVDNLGVIAERIDGLEPENARLLVAFAMVLARTARADLDISDDERSRMVDIVADFGELERSDADLVVELTTELADRHGGTQEYIATRELKRLARPADRERLLRCFFAVCAADDSITLLEEEEVRQMATELGFEHAEYTAARAAFREHREVLKR